MSNKYYEVVIILVEIHPEDFELPECNNCGNSISAIVDMNGTLISLCEVCVEELKSKLKNNIPPELLFENKIQDINLQKVLWKYVNMLFGRFFF